MSVREREIKIIEEMDKHGIAVKTTKWVEHGTERWGAMGIPKPPELGGGDWPRRMFDAVGTSELDALKALGRNLRRVRFNQKSRGAIEPDQEYEAGLRLVDADHCLDRPMVPDRQIMTQEFKALGFDEEEIEELIERQKSGLKHEL